MNTRAGQRSKSMSTILRLGNSMSTLRVCGLAMFLLLPAACSNAPASTPNRTDETATPGEPNIATAHQALETAWSPQMARTRSCRFRRPIPADKK